MIGNDSTSPFYLSVYANAKRPTTSDESLRHYLHDVYNARMAKTYFSGYCHLHLACRCRHLAPQWSRLNPTSKAACVCSKQGPASCHKIMVPSTFHRIQTSFQLKCIVCSASWKANILKVELSVIKIGELLREVWSLRSCLLILPPGALTPQGIKSAMKRGVSKHWWTLQWCASRGWVIAHDN